MKIKILLAITLLGFVAWAGDDDIQRRTGISGISSATANATYLKLDGTNSPLTGALSTFGLNHNLTKVSIGVDDNYAILTTDEVVIATMTCGAKCTGNEAVTLPAISASNDGQLVALKHVGTKALDVKSTGADTIDGAALPPVMTFDASWYVFQADNAAKDWILRYDSEEFEVVDNRGAASGYASLDASTLVVENPANATATPTASKIPIAESSGKLAAGWLPEGVPVLWKSWSGTSKTIAKADVCQTDWVSVGSATLPAGSLGKYGSLEMRVVVDFQAFESRTCFAAALNIGGTRYTAGNFVNLSTIPYIQKQTALTNSGAEAVNLFYEAALTPYTNNDHSDRLVIDTSGALTVGIDISGTGDGVDGSTDTVDVAELWVTYRNTAP